jgi:hypothetical protein
MATAGIHESSIPLLDFNFIIELLCVEETVQLKIVTNHAFPLTYRYTYFLELYGDNNSQEGVSGNFGGADSILSELLC